jgi:hypothetical protein
MRAAKLTIGLLVLLTFLPAVPATGPLPGLTIAVSNPQRFTTDISYDFSPVVVQGVDGTAWVFWSYTFFNGRASLPVINYRTSSSPNYIYNSSAWSPSQTLVSTPLSQNIAPSVTQFRNGTIYLSFASNRTGNYDIFLKRYSPQIGWSSDQQITLNPADEKTSSVVAASDGSLWVFWDRIVSPTSSNIFYKVSRNGSWSMEQPLTNDTSAIENLEPSSIQTNDGSLWMVWSRLDTASNLRNLYYRVYRSGSWSGSVQLTSNANQDNHPHVTQDSNNTIWVAWNRELPVSITVFQNDVFYSYSVDNGASFVPETNLTNDTGCSTICPEDIMSSLAQLKDGRIYVFWASNRDPQNYWDLYYATTSPQPFHHVAVTALSAAPLKLRAGGLININVTVVNTGTFPESFWLFVKGTNTSSMTIAVVSLNMAPGQSMLLSIDWNTTGTRPAKYQLSANIVITHPEYQIVTGDNTLTGGKLWLVPPGDVNMDGRCDILDVALVAAAFGSTVGSPTWNPAADFTRDGKVDILDVAIVAYWFGTYT